MIYSFSNHVIKNKVEGLRQKQDKVRRVPKRYILAQHWLKVDKEKPRYVKSDFKVLGHDPILSDTQ